MVYYSLATSVDSFTKAICVSFIVVISFYVVDFYAPCVFRFHVACSCI